MAIRRYVSKTTVHVLFFLRNQIIIFDFQVFQVNFLADCLHYVAVARFPGSSVNYKNDKVTVNLFFLLFSSNGLAIFYEQSHIKCWMCMLKDKND